MSVIEPRLTLINGSSVIPVNQTTLMDWQQPLSGTANKLLALCHSQNWHAPELISTLVPENRIYDLFPESREDQAVLAMQALSSLLQKKRHIRAVEACDLTLLCTNSCDESLLYRSLATTLAAESGVENKDHFAVSQMQGATFGCALEITNAMLPAAGSGATIVAVERWPLPSSRFTPLAPTLADGAVALWLEQQTEPNGLSLLGLNQNQVPPFIQQPLSIVETCTQLQSRRAKLALDERNTMCSALTVQRENVEKGVSESIAACLEHLNLQATDIDIWLPSGLNPAFDARVLRRLSSDIEVSRHFLPPQKGYFCAASTPLTLCYVLEAWQSGALESNVLLLTWGLSLSGCISVQVWKTSGTPLCK